MVRDGDDHPGIPEARLDVGPAPGLARVAPVPARDFQGVAEELGPAGHRPDVRLHAVAVVQPLAGRHGLVQKRTAAQEEGSDDEDPPAHGP